MKYDVVVELLSKGLDISKSEGYILNSIFSNFRVKEIKKDSSAGHIKSCKVSLINGIDVFLEFRHGDMDDYNMYIYSDILQSDNNMIRSLFHLKTGKYDVGGNIDFEIGIKGEHGYYIVSSKSEQKMFFNMDNKLSLKLSYYDKDAEDYYKYRKGKAKFSNPSINELEYYGIVPDSFSVVEYENYHDALNVFGDLLGNSGKFFEYILEMAEFKKKLNR